MIGLLRGCLLRWAVPDHSLALEASQIGNDICMLMGMANPDAHIAVGPSFKKFGDVLCVVQRLHKTDHISTPQGKRFDGRDVPLGIGIVKKLASSDRRLGNVHANVMALPIMRPQGSKKISFAAAQIQQHRVRTQFWYQELHKLMRTEGGIGLATTTFSLPNQSLNEGRREPGKRKSQLAAPPSQSYQRLMFQHREPESLGLQPRLKFAPLSTSKGS